MPRSVPFNGGIIVEVPGREYEVQIPGGSNVKVFERNAVAIHTAHADSQNSAIAGGFGRALSDHDAWERAVAEVKKQL